MHVQDYGIIAVFFQGLYLAREGILKKKTKLQRASNLQRSNNKNNYSTHVHVIKNACSTKPDI